ncbi:hypothetical protein Ahia01_001000200 [Argonauta hians]
MKPVHTTILKGLNRPGEAQDCHHHNDYEGGTERGKGGPSQVRSPMMTLTSMTGLVVLILAVATGMVPGAGAVKKDSGNCKEWPLWGRGPLASPMANTGGGGYPILVALVSAY